MSINRGFERGRILKNPLTHFHGFKSGFFAEMLAGRGLNGDFWCGERRGKRGGL